MASLKSWRRAMAALGLTAWGVFVCSAVAEESPPLGPSAHFRAIKVDVSQAADYGGAPAANWAAEALPAALNEAFAGRIAPGDRSAPTLIVRIDRIGLGPTGSGGPASPVNSVEARDYIEGAGVVVGPNGQTLGVYPLLDTVFNYTGGVNYELGSYQRRVDVLARDFAHFLPGKMGL
jgi:hypothetical protein